MASRDACPNNIRRRCRSTAWVVCLGLWEVIYKRMTHGHTCAAAARTTATLTVNNAVVSDLFSTAASIKPAYGRDRRIPISASIGKASRFT